MERFDDIEDRLRTALRPDQIPESYDTGSRIERLLTHTPSRPTRPHWTFALTAVILLMVTTSFVLATSTAAQEQLRALIGIRAANNRLDSVSPRTPLAVFQPSYLPSGMVLVTTAYNAGSTVGGSSQPSVSSTMSRVDGREIAPDVAATATGRGNLLLSTANGPIVVLIFANEAKQVVEVIQQPIGKSMPKGDPMIIRQTAGVRFQDAGREVFAWAEQGTLIQVATTLPHSEAIRIAEGLQQTPLGTVQSAISASPPAWVTVPLARRTQTVQKVSFDHDEAAKTCGMWDASNHSKTGYEQVLCVARLVSGERAGNSGVDRYPWEQAATRLGVATSIGPPGNPLVYLVQLNVSERGGSVVVLDAVSGEPYFLVTLGALP